MKLTINVVWFKRDLRLKDHEPLSHAIEESLPCLLLYVFEPELINDKHYSERHWRFVTQSIKDMNQTLIGMIDKGDGVRGGGVRGDSVKIQVAHADMLSVLNDIQQKATIKSLFSHEETGLAKTFLRDQGVALWCREHKVTWKEYQKDAVIRGLRNREQWEERWHEKMNHDCVNPKLNKLIPFRIEFDTSALPRSWLDTNANMQLGGEKEATKILDSFISDRSQHYQRHISKPFKAQASCSRLSPYLAWGNLSLRQVYQRYQQAKNHHPWRRALTAFASRLHWHCHFVQKFESESQMQTRPINRAYLNFAYRDSLECRADYLAWQSGHTGYPLVDAAMRCLEQTGYINFRMRAMLVSFLCHHLNIDWRMGVHHLARVFLDFEPGIHYPQFQMQAGVTGINTIRIYNPTKQAKENDEDGDFILQWCPELRVLPKPLFFDPSELTPMEQQYYELKLGVDYPLPIVNLTTDNKATRTQLWSFRKRSDARLESQRILARHVRPD